MFTWRCKDEELQQLEKSKQREVLFIIPELLVGKKPHDMSCSVYPLILFASVYF